jgi:hypothetical protein
MQTGRTLNDFISNIKSRSLAKQNRFTLAIEGGLNSQDGNLVELFCEQAVLPGLNFASQPTRSFGEQREVVYDRTFESIQLTFLVDREMKVKQFFDKWSNQIINPSSRLVGYYDDYVRRILVVTQDTKDNDTYQSLLYEAYPKTIGAVQLDQNSKDVMKLQVTFNYKYHVNILKISPSGDESTMFKPDVIKQTNITQQMGNYLNGSSGVGMPVPSLYYDNFQQYQENLNDRLSITKSLGQIERQGIVTGLGSKLSGFIGGL